jgi:hypothetical protein
MTNSSSQLADQTIEYFNNIQHLIRNNIPERFNEKNLFTNFLNGTFNLLLFDEIESVRTEIISAIEEGVKEGGRPERTDAYDLLLLELKFFNTRYNYNTNSRTMYLEEINSKEQYEASEVALGSIDKLLHHLPKWLRNVIEVIREALSIAKAFH